MLLQRLHLHSGTNDLQDERLLSEMTLAETNVDLVVKQMRAVQKHFEDIYSQYSSDLIRERLDLGQLQRAAQEQAQQGQEVFVEESQVEQAKALRAEITRLKEEVQVAEEELAELMTQKDEKEVLNVKLKSNLEALEKNRKKRLFDCLFGIEWLKWEECAEDDTIYVEARFTRGPHNKEPFVVPIAPLTATTDLTICKRVVENMDWVWDEIEAQKDSENLPDNVAQPQRVVLSCKRQPMAYTIWSIMTMAFLPAGAILVILLLSGLRPLENLGSKICEIEVSVGHHLRLTLPFLIAFICSGCFVGEWLALNRLYQKKETMQLTPLEFNDSWKALLWRHQRNWWLALSCTMLWMIVYRVSIVVRTLRQEIQSSSKAPKANAQQADIKTDKKKL